MPLLDHFRPPLYPRRHWESLHASWSNNIMARLVQNNGTIDLRTKTSKTLAISPLPGMMAGGNFNQGNAAFLYLQITSGYQADVVYVVGTATFGGTLNVSMIPQMPVSVTWTLIDYGEWNNTQFANVVRPADFSMPNYVPVVSITWTPPN